MKTIVVIIFVSLIVLIVLSFVGVEPLKSYKNTVVARLEYIFSGDPESGVHTPTLLSTTITPTTTLIPSNYTSSLTKPSEKTSTTSQSAPSTTVTKQLLAMTGMTCDWDRKDEAVLPSLECNVTVALLPTDSTQPGYFNIEIQSKLHNYGVKSFKYLRGDTISPLTWRIKASDSGDTWRALVSPANLTDIFSIKYTFNPFEALTLPDYIGASATNIEEALFNRINAYRISSKRKALSWNQMIQSDVRKQAYYTLKEGVVSYSQLNAPYIGQIVTSVRVIQGETVDDTTKRIYNTWFDNNEARLKMLNENYISMAIGLLTETLENKYYVVALFSSK